MADDDAAGRGARGRADRARPAAPRSTTAAPATRKAIRKAAAGVQPSASGSAGPAKRSTPRKTAAPATGAGAKKAARSPASPSPAKKGATTKRAPAAKQASTTEAAVGGSRARKAGAVLAGGPPAKTSGRRAGAGKAAARRLSAEQTFDDDWEAPAPPAEPLAEDPNARVRSLLRAAARSLEDRDRGQKLAPAPRVPPAEEPEPPTRVLIAPEPAAAAPIARARPAGAPPTQDMTIDDMAIDDMAIDDEAAAGGDAVKVEAVAGTAVEDRGEGARPAPVLADAASLREQRDEQEDWAPPEVLEAEDPPRPGRVTLAPPAPPAPPPGPSGPEPSATPPTPPPAWEPQPERRPGPGLPVLAIVLSLVLPLIGAVLGFVLATRARRRGAPLAGLARIVAVLAFVAWLVGGGLGVAAYARNDRGIDYSQLKVGDCFNSSASNEVRGIKVIPCSKDHNSEIFFLVTHPSAKGAPYPGKDQLVQFAADACLGQPLTDYLGVPLEQSKLKDFEIVPQASAWKDGRRVLVCGLDTGGQGRIKGSVKGTRR